MCCTALLLANSNYGDIMDKELEDKFHDQMLEIYAEAAKVINPPTRFRNMVHEYGGLQTAKRLLDKTRGITSGLEELAKKNRTDISVEAHALEEPWAQLFTEEEKEYARAALEAVKLLHQ